MDELDGASSICDGILKAFYHDPHKNFMTEGLLYLKGACRPDLSAQKQAISSQLAGLDFKSSLLRIFLLLFSSHNRHLHHIFILIWNASQSIGSSVGGEAGKGLMSKLSQTLKKGSHEKVM